MSSRPTSRALAFVLTAVLVPVAAACGGDSTGPEASNSVQVTLRKAEAAPDPVGSTSPSAGVATGDLVTLPDVQVLNVTVTRVEVRAVGSDEDGWVSVSVLNDSQTADLLTLPESGDGIALASSELDPGDYRNVRLFFSDATITFRETTTVRGEQGASDQEFDGENPHELTIPGGQEAGLQLATESFAVPASEEGGNVVRVLVDVTASIGTIAVTPDQGLIMNPALEAETGTTQSDSGS